MHQLLQIISLNFKLRNKSLTYTYNIGYNKLHRLKQLLKIQPCKIKKMENIINTINYTNITITVNSIETVELVFYCNLSRIRVWRFG